MGMSRKSIVLGFWLITILSIAFFFFQKSNSVERYGVVRGYSSSGDARFNYYDIERKEVLDSQGGYQWFWALPENMMEEKSIDDYYNYIRDNSDAVFKIKGSKWEDDCGYYADGSCLEQILVEKIEVVVE
jgi:hypothetical protein